MLALHRTSGSVSAICGGGIWEMADCTAVVWSGPHPPVGSATARAVTPMRIVSKHGAAAKRIHRITGLPLSECRMLNTSPPRDLLLCRRRATLPHAAATEQLD